MSLITYDNFWDEVKFFCHGQPKKADGLGLIVTGIDSEHAQTWIQYAKDKGWPQRADYFAKMLKQGNSLTMPCADPRTFDPEYSPKSQRDDFRREHVSMHPEERHSIAEQVRAVVANSRPPRDRKREDYQERQLSHAEILAGLKEKAEREPLALSPELADRMGLRRFDEAAE